MLWIGLEFEPLVFVEGEWDQAIDLAPNHPLSEADLGHQEPRQTTHRYIPGGLAEGHL